jgi:hypothetical protein
LVILADSKGNGMDAERFDDATRAFTVPSRRTVLGVLVGSTLTSLGMAESEAKRKKKKKKKCKRPRVRCGKKCCASGQFCAGGQCAATCVLEDVGAILRLRANCATTSTIVIPDGTDFDGNGKTISLIGNLDGFDGAGVVGGDATVSNLTIDGSGLSGPCDPFLSSVTLLGWDGGEIDNVTANNNRCGNGVAGNTPITITMVSSSGIRPESSSVRFAAVALLGLEMSAGTVAGCLIRDSDTGISLGDVNAGIYDNDIRNVIVGIEVFDSVADIENNFIEGPGSGVANSAGVSFESGGGGSVTDSTISNVACGIFEAADAGTVTQSMNTFTGNGNDSCVET